MPKSIITDAQAETIRKLRSVGYGIGSQFLPRDIFPVRDNVDNGHRRTLRALAAKGIIGRSQSGIPGELEITQATVDAYDHWYAKRGFNVEFSC